MTKIQPKMGQLQQQPPQQRPQFGGAGQGAGHQHHAGGAKSPSFSGTAGMHGISGASSTPASNAFAANLPPNFGQQVNLNRPQTSQKTIAYA